MARSFGLAAYRALTKRGDAVLPDIGTPKPDGEMIWLHAGDADIALALMDLAKRICTLREGLSVLLTVPIGTPLPPEDTLPGGGQLLIRNVPDEHPISVTAFVSHWRPDLCLWARGGLRPNLLLDVQARRIPMFLIDADTAGFDGRKDRWLRPLAKQLLAAFEAIFAQSNTARRRLVQLGASESQLTVIDPLLPIGYPLHADDADVAEFAEAVVGRPIWFANGILPEELPMVFAAHRAALRMSHRLLLVLRPTTTLDVDAVQQFRVAMWDDGEYPDDNSQVLITQDARDAGLFYRVAPVSFIGSTLTSGAQAHDPFEAAALGSAVLYGPKVGRYLPSYTRLASAGAARIVNDGAGLGNAVSQLVSPEQAAIMAHAGWDVVSEGAAVADLLTELVQEVLDQNWNAP